MADVKAQELSHDEWYALLEPYGYADITVQAAAARFHGPPLLLEYEIRMMLKGSDDRLGEWAHRSYLLEQARLAVTAVKARGYLIADAPRIEFGGQYTYVAGRKDPSWLPGAELRFSVRLAP